MLLSSIFLCVQNIVPIRHSDVHVYLHIEQEANGNEYSARCELTQSTCDRITQDDVNTRCERVCEQSV